MLQELPPSERSDTAALTIETERLSLRHPVLADCDAIARLINDRRIAENLRRVPHPYHVSHAREFLAGLDGAGRETTFLILRANELIGMVGLDWSRTDGAELGYWLGLPFWGCGYATEAAQAVIDLAFEDHDVARLHAAARVANPASRRVLEKCGFQWSGVELHRSVALGSSTPVDCLYLDRGVWASLRSWGVARRRQGAT